MNNGAVVVRLFGAASLPSPPVCRTLRKGVGPGMRLPERHQPARLGKRWASLYFDVGFVSLVWPGRCALALSRSSPASLGCAWIQRRPSSSALDRCRLYRLLLLGRPIRANFVLGHCFQGWSLHGAESRCSRLRSRLARFSRHSRIFSQTQTNRRIGRQSWRRSRRLLLPLSYRRHGRAVGWTTPLFRWCFLGIGSHRVHHDYRLVHHIINVETAVKGTVIVVIIVGVLDRSCRARQTRPAGRLALRLGAEENARYWSITDLLRGRFTCGRVRVNNVGVSLRGRSQVCFRRRAALGQLLRQARSLSEHGLRSWSGACTS